MCNLTKHSRYSEFPHHADTDGNTSSLMPAPTLAAKPQIPDFPQEKVFQLQA